MSLPLGSHWCATDLSGFKSWIFGAALLSGMYFVILIQVCDAMMGSYLGVVSHAFGVIFVVVS